MEKKHICALIILAILINGSERIFYPIITTSLLYFAFFTVKDWGREAKRSVIIKAIYSILLATATIYLIILLEVAPMVLFTLIFRKS